MNDTPPTSRWNNENDPRGEKRRFLIKAEHLKAYQRTWNQFDKGLKKLKDSMRDNARKADCIQNEKLKELARTIQRSEDKETTGASRVAMTQISEDVALEILQNEDCGSSVEPIIAATIETLGSRHGIVRPWTDTTSATPANALKAPLHSIESDLAASSPAVSGTLKTPAASHSTTKDISQDMAILAETAKTPCPTCGMSKHSSDSDALPAKRGRILQYGDRMKGTPPRKKRSQSNRYTTQEDEQSPEVVAFEIEKDFSLLNGPLMDNHIVSIPQEIVPVKLRLSDGMKALMNKYAPVRVRADIEGCCVDFGFGTIGQVRARKCFEGLKGGMFNRFVLKMRLYEHNYRVVDSTL